MADEKPEWCDEKTWKDTALILRSLHPVQWNLVRGPIARALQEGKSVNRTHEIKDKVAECLAGMDYSDASPWARRKIEEAINLAARAILAHDIDMVLCPAAEARVANLEKALGDARERFNSARSAIETNQVVDKDVHGIMQRGIREIDEVLGK